MFSLPTNAKFLRTIAIAVLLIAANDCMAQQQNQALFVIKTPSVAKTAYGKKPKAIRVAGIVQQDATTPREDLDKDPVPPKLKEDFEKFDDMEPLDDPMDLEDENELLVEDEDDFDREPKARPMTTWNLKPMSSISATMRPTSGKSPQDQSSQLTSRGFMPDASSAKLFAWAAPEIRYNPLYFEDVALERYGQTRGFIRQPLVSGVHFLKSAALVPYYSLYDPVNSCDGPLGYCRPGVCTNCVQSRHFFGNPFQGAPQRPCTKSCCTSGQ